MELTVEKWLVMAALALISIFLGVIPLMFFRKKSKTFPTVSSKKSLSHQIILTSLSCFGGGVLLATCLCHMLTEAREDLSQIQSLWDRLPHDFPLSEVLSLVGFLLIYLVEEIAHTLMEGSDHHHEIVRHNSSIHRPSTTIIAERKGSSVKRPDVTEIDKKNMQVGESSFEDEPKPGVASFMRSMMALIALSFHAIMEGVAIGVQDATGVWFMFGAVASHKFVISFCMGMELFAARTKLSTYLSSIIFFGVISPVGIFIGSLISGNDTNILPIAIIKALSTGTLIYVVFFEILNREREKKSHKGPFSGPSSKYIGFLQCLSITFGITAMILLLTLNGHSHGHEEDDDEAGSLLSTTTMLSPL